MKKFLAISCLLLSTFLPGSFAQLTALDSAFSSDGILEVDSLRLSPVSKTHLVLQPDGKVVAAGTYGFWSVSGYQMGALLMRFHPDGRRDSTFGQTGKARLRGNANENTIGLQLMPDGRIITATATDVYQGNSYTLHRLLSDGSPDFSFNDSGKLVFRPNVSQGHIYYRHLALQSDGKLLLTGYWEVPPLFHFLNVFRHNADGSPDSSYGYYGRSSNGLFNTYKITGRAMVHQPDGKLLIVGNAQDTPLWYNRDKALIARCLPDGSLDTSFNAGLGYFKHTTPGERGSIATSVLVRPNGKILLATLSQRRFDGPWICAVMQLHANGQLDGTFGINGTVEADSIPEDLVYTAPPALALQSDGRILLAYTEGMDTATQKFAVRRLLAGGSIDASFGSDGKVSTRVSSYPGQASAIAVQPDGRVIAAGVNVHLMTGYTSLGLVRYHPYITLPSAIPAPMASQDRGLHIFPNPARDAVHISCTLNAAGPVHVGLHDTKARVVQQWSLGSKSIGVMSATLQLAPALPPGQYILRLTTGDRTISGIVTKQ